MWGGIVSGVVAPEQQETFATQYKEFFTLRAQQPGKLGDMDIDLGDGRTINLVLWESLAAHDAVHPLLLPEYNRLVRPLFNGPTTLVGTGDVAYNSYTRGAGFAVVGSIVVAPGEQDAFQEALQAFRAIRAQQPGFRGSIEFASADGRLLLLVLWDKPEDRALAAQQPGMQQGWARVVATLATAPTFPGSGMVVRDTITPPEG